MDTRSFPLVAPFGLALFALGACQTLSIRTSRRDPEPAIRLDLAEHVHVRAPDADEATRAKDTLQLGFAWVDRQRDDEDPVRDAFSGWSLWFAHDLWSGVVRPAVEAGAGYSEHSVVGFKEPLLEIYRVCAGGKLTLQPEGSPLSAYGRMGWFYRFSWDPSFEAEPYDQDGGGYYLGTGLEVQFDSPVRGGVFVDYFKGHGVDPLEERMFGISVGVAF
ncbi:MAG: hypothetical protein IPJ77_03330 [Planctomycetes bacterium]|nr:hypothetical protein [Planctomycetota bacterium]